MNAKLWNWIMLGTVILTGCLPTLNAVYTDKDLIFDSALVGSWKQAKSAETWEFTKRDDKSYNLVYTDGNGESGRFIARLAQIEGTLLLDLFPEEVQSGENGFYKFHLVPIHTVYLVRRTKPDVELAAIDYRWLETYLTEHPDGIAHATFNGRKLITAPTAELQAFVVQHKDEFKAEFSLQRESVKTN